jgi:DeoR/GlpR family transcriptional regulator of sugar metabolism
MNKDNRINAIRLLIIRNKQLLVSELANTFDVNERTIRRDLSELKEKGILELFFGGARLIEINKAEKFRTIGKKNNYV